MLLLMGVAVFVSSGVEDKGLPLAPSQTLYVELRNASGLKQGNKVHVGGAQVGSVTELRPVLRSDGRVVARAKLRIEEVGAVPADSTFAVRSLSALGLKYLELTVGRSRRKLTEGATVPARRTRVATDIDRLFSMFDAETRRAVRGNQLGYGDALAGRGSALNELLARAPRLATELDEGMSNLSRRETDLAGFFRGLDRFSEAIAPVSDAMARSFTEMADTFAALSTDGGEPLRDTIERQPGTLEVGTRSLRTSRPMLHHLAALQRDLRGAAEELGDSLPPTTRALRTATPVTRRSTELSERLEGALGALDRLAAAPTSGGALRGLTATVGSLQPFVRYVGPFLTVCNYWNIWWTTFASTFNERDAWGHSARLVVPNASQQDDSLGAMDANEFAHGENVVPGGIPQHLHADTFGAPAVTEDGLANCFQGQNGYTERGAPVVPDQETYGRVVLEPSSRRGRAGPTYKRFDERGRGQGLNRDRVPPAQTFSATPGGRGANP